MKSFEPERILYTNRKESVKGKNSGFEFVSFDDLLQKSDFLICTCALNKETELIFNKSAFSKMKSNVIFINVSRGDIVQQEDLFNALNERRIQAAGLDVTSPLFLEKNHKMLSLQNCFITPYIGKYESLFFRPIIFVSN